MRLPQNPPLFLLTLVAIWMVFCCQPCGSEYETSRGLDQHQRHCEEFLQVDSSASVVDNALEKYAQRKARKKRKLNAVATEPVIDDDMPGVEVSHF